jgi:hypothetical protein
VVSGLPPGTGRSNYAARTPRPARLADVIGGAAKVMAKSVTPEQRQEGAAKTVEENGLSGVIPASTKREFQGDALPAVGIN